MHAVPDVLEEDLRRAEDPDRTTLAEIASAEFVVQHEHYFRDRTFAWCRKTGRLDPGSPDAPRRSGHHAAALEVPQPLVESGRLVVVTDRVPVLSKARDRIVVLAGACCDEEIVVGDVLSIAQVKFRARRVDRRDAGVDELAPVMLEQRA